MKEDLKEIGRVCVFVFLIANLIIFGSMYVVAAFLFWVKVFGLGR